MLVSKTPWVHGQLRAHPRDLSYPYGDLLSGAQVGTDTPLLCTITYEAATRQRLFGGKTRRWLSADNFSTATLVLRLHPSVVADVPLTRPVLLRKRTWRFIRKEFDLIDHALWPRR